MQCVGEQRGGRRGKKETVHLSSFVSSSLLLLLLCLVSSSISPLSLLLFYFSFLVSSSLTTSPLPFLLFYFSLSFSSLLLLLPPLYFALSLLPPSLHPCSFLLHSSLRGVVNVDRIPYYDLGSLMVGRRG